MYAATHDDWNGYLSYEAAYDAEPDAFRKIPLKVKLPGLVASETTRRTWNLAEGAGEVPCIKYVDYNDVEWFRDDGPKVVFTWKPPRHQESIDWGDRQRKLEEMLALGLQKWPEGLVVDGTPSFQKAVFDIAYERGIKIQGDAFSTYVRHRREDQQIRLSRRRAVSYEM
jgi:conjugative element/phage-associated large polyvalent protein